MERHASALKAARQAKKKNERNRAARASFRSLLKKVREEAAKKYPTKEEAKKVLSPLLNEAQKVLMKAASKNLIKKKTASRYVSRLSSLMN